TQKKKTWTQSSVLNVIKNEVYTGVVQWRKREEKKSRIPGKRRDSRTRDRSEWIIAKGKHEPLISEELFRKAHERLKTRYHVPHHKISNPLAGIVKCGKC